MDIKALLRSLYAIVNPQADPRPTAGTNTPRTAYQEAEARLRSAAPGSQIAASQAVPQPVAPQVNGLPTAEDFQRGITNWQADAPLATQSAALARAASQMQGNVDPYLPAVMGIMETGGGAKQVGQNNAYNLLGEQNGQQKFVDYPNPETALLGGDNNGVQSQGFVGNLNTNPAYAQYRQTGDLKDFFKAYTPSSDPRNPAQDELIRRYSDIRSRFDK